MKRKKFATISMNVQVDFYSQDLMKVMLVTKNVGDTF